MEPDFRPEDAAPWPDRAGEETSAAPSDERASAEPTEPAFGARELLLGGLVVVLTGVGVLALLLARETPAAASSPAADPAGRVVAAHSATDAAWTERAPRWTANREGWLGRNAGIALEVLAAEPVKAWMTTVRPALVVRCTGKRTDVFVFTDSAAKIEANSDDHSVSYAFDDEAPASMRWPDGAEHNALFAPDGSAIARRLMASNTFTFTFTPHNAAQATVRFNTAGLGPLLKSGIKHCW